jgi:DNA phosphorothioation-associated putative methyltransferase
VEQTRHRTAMHRQALSVPAQRALLDGLLAGGALDYGCGRGGDVRRLLAAGVAARGWDPHYRPEPEPEPAPAVLCSYVLNVIDDPAERLATLQAAWGLAQDVLVLAVRTDREARRVSGTPEADGLITSRGTFQALLPARGLVEWVEQALGRRPVPAGTGLMYVFRSDAARAAHLSDRFARGRGPVRCDPQKAADTLAGIAGWLADRGRPPTAEEDRGGCRAARSDFGGTGRAAAAAVAAGLVDERSRAGAERRAKDDLIVLLALDAFHGRTRASDLPPSSRADATAFYGSFGEASRQAQRLLVFLSRRDLMAKAARASRIGKLTPTALYVHTSATAHLSAPLRAYAACAELVAGRPQEANLVKLHHDRAAVSFLSYPEFDEDAHPLLASSLLVDLATRTADWTDYSGRTNRPLLHRKEEFVGPDHPARERWARLTAREAKAGLYRDPPSIGTADGWQRALDAAGAAVRGHRLFLRKQ